MKFGYQTLVWANYHSDYDIEEPIKEIKEAGFKGVEFVEPISKLGNPESLKQSLAKEGLEAASISCGLNMNPKDTTDIDETKKRIDFARVCGVKDVMLCGGWLSEGKEIGKTEDAYKILAEKIDVCCEHASKSGMNIAFHPHKDTIVETQEDMERFLDFTDKPKLCLDIAHLAACGNDPVEVIKSFREITTYVHLKDWDNEKKEFVELGKGKVDIVGCVGTLKQTGFNGWAVVELDRTTSTPKESAKRSADYLKRMGLL